MFTKQLSAYGDVALIDVRRSMSNFSIRFEKIKNLPTNNKMQHSIKRGDNHERH